MPACAPKLRLVPPLIIEPSSGRVLLVLAEVVEVVDEVVEVSPLEVFEDCGAVLTGDHDARAMAEKVSDGEEPLHPASPQHSQTSVLEFHWIHVALSLAGRHALVNTTPGITVRWKATHCRRYDTQDRRKCRLCIHRHNS